MLRTAQQKLTQWRTSVRRKPLVLMGARQVGKTHLLESFAKSDYENSVTLNFEDTPKLASIFQPDRDPHRIIKAIKLELDVTINPETTLLIFDEIQACPEALNSLKYFNEKANEYHIASAGSLLGVKMKHTQGFPVGKVNFEHLYPMSFMEFLLATGHERYYDYLTTLDEIKPIPEITHDSLLSLLKSYLLVGGMPEAVDAYRVEQDFMQARKVQKDILTAYELDFAKHAPPVEVMRIHDVWDGIPNQLAKENKKFIYSVIRQGARAKDYEIAIQWLLEAGMICKVSHMTTPKLPLSACINRDIFKLYQLDVGLLCAMAKIEPRTILQGDQLLGEFKGALTENYVAQSLLPAMEELYYWTSSGKAEVDHLIAYNNSIYPLEVKSGYTRRKQSLTSYQQHHQPKLVIRTSPRNLKLDNSFLNCPLYLVERLPQLLEMTSV